MSHLKLLLYIGWNKRLWEWLITFVLGLELEISAITSGLAFLKECTFGQTDVDSLHSKVGLRLTFETLVKLCFQFI